MRLLAVPSPSAVDVLPLTPAITWGVLLLLFMIVGVLVWAGSSRK